MKINYFFLFILICLIIYFCVNQQGDIFAKPTNYQPTVNYRSDKIINPSTMGFVKPEQRLLKTFDSISSSNKVKPSGTCQRFSFTKHTIETNIESYVQSTLKDMIQSINHISTSEYYLKDIENVYIMTNQLNEKRFIVDFFVYDVQNYYTIRLLTDIVILDQEIYLNYLNVYSGSNQILMNKYDIKHNRMGVLFDANMFDDNIDHLFDTYYESHFKLLKPTDDLSSVFQVSTLKNTFMPASMTKTSIEEFEKKDLSHYLEMYLPENQNTIKSPLFCEKYTHEWDNKGIFKEKKDINKNDCYFHNEQTLSEINEPYFAPSVINPRSRDDFFQKKGNIITSL